MISKSAVARSLICSFLLLASSLVTSKDLNPLHFLLSVPSAYAACSPGFTNLFTGTAQAGYANADAVQANITTDTNPITCDPQNNGNSYWVMVIAPAGHCGKAYAYAQVGWLIAQGGATTPHTFVETNGHDYGCDNPPYSGGPIILTPGTPVSGTHTYMVQIVQSGGVNYASFYVDGYGSGAYSIDWSNSNSIGYEIEAETHEPEDFVSGGDVDFTNTLQCETASQYGCTPNSTFTVSPVDQGNNPNGIYQVVSYDGNGNANGFRVCDTRVTTSICVRGTSPAP